VSKCILALFFRTPEDLSGDLPSTLGDIDRASPVLARWIDYILFDLNLGSEERRLDQEVALVGRVHDSNSGEETRKPGETEDGINRGICKANVERGVGSDGMDQEFPTGMVLCVSDEGKVTANGTVRGFDEELGGIGVLIFLAVKFLFRGVRKGNVDNDGRVLGLEYQKLCGGVVSDNHIIFGLDRTAVDVKSLWYSIMSYLSNVTS
jgi:hypothetical protein